MTSLLTYDLRLTTYDLRHSKYIPCMPKLLAALLLLPALLTAQQRSVPYTPGMVITASTRIEPGTYQIPAGDSVGLVIRGNDISVDMRRVELVGDSVRTQPDRFTGTGIIIDGGRNVTLRGVTIRGVKHGIVARGTHTPRAARTTTSRYNSETAPLLARRDGVAGRLALVPPTRSASGCASARPSISRT